MANAPNRQISEPQVDLHYLSRLLPLAHLETERLVELRKHLNVKTIPAGTHLFSRGDRNTTVYYLAAGEVDLIVNQARTTLTATAPQARQPIDPHNPRHFTAVTRTAVKVLEIDRGLLDIFVSREQRTGYIVKEIEESGPQASEEDWMETILQSKIFQKIPPVNIQTMFSKLQPLTVRKNEVIFRQNTEGDYYYLIKSGGCAVLRIDNPEEGWRMIAELGPGQGFGEEALLSEKPRNATIQMTSDGVLLRLSRDDFNQLLKTPVVKTVSYENALELVNSGAIWLDARTQAEHAAGPNMPGAVNIPVAALRDSLQSIPREHPLIVYCDNAQRSACAAYILNAHGFEAIVLDGGINALRV